MITDSDFDLVLKHLDSIKPYLENIKTKVVAIDQRREYLEDELERTHIFLDSLNIPRTCEGREYTSEDLSLVGRIKVALGRRDYR